MNWITIRFSKLVGLLFSFLCLLIMVAACSPAAQPDGQPTAGEALTSGQSLAPPKFTPIPNLRADAVLDENFGGFVADLRIENALISRDELVDLQASDAVYLIDLRNPIVVKKTGHIPTAVLIPLRELGRNSSVLPDFSDPIVGYCEDTAECLIAVTGLGVYGWNIRVLEDGFSGWTAANQPISTDPIAVPEIDPFKPAFPCCGIYEQSSESDVVNPDAPDAALVAATDRIFKQVPGDFGVVTAAEFEQDLQQNAELVVIDLRPSDTLGVEPVVQAANLLNIPFANLIASRDLWPVGKTTPIVLYSEDGILSTVAKAIFWAYGYEEVRDLGGGLAGWRTAVSGNSTP
jgi:rhodanese-related sulfurtransferase